MKKLLLVFAVALFAISANAQNFNIGINAGLPIGDAGDGWTFSALIDVSYLWNVSETVDAGVATGFSHSFGDEIDLGSFGTFEVDDASFIPLAGAVRFSVSDNFSLGADLGYAIGIAPDDNDGGFYYSPRMQYSVSDSLDIVAAYRGISVEDGSFDIISLGIEFGL
jgi:hypothetical protein